MAQPGERVFGGPRGGAAMADYRSKGTRAKGGRRQPRCHPVAGGPSERCLFLLRLFPLALVAEVLAGFPD